MTATTDLVVPDASLEAVRRVGASDALALLRAAADHIARLAEEYRGDPFATGAALIHVDTLMGDLRTIVGMLQRWTADAMPAKRITIPDVGVLERTTAGGKDSWEDRAMLARVIAHRRAAGFVNGPEDVPDVVLRYAAVGYWRKTPLREDDIPFDDLLDARAGTPSVKINARSTTTSEENHDARPRPEG